jgi:hypothetical protein
MHRWPYRNVLLHERVCPVKLTTKIVMFGICSVLAGTFAAVFFYLAFCGTGMKSSYGPVLAGLGGTCVVIYFRCSDKLERLREEYRGERRSGS